MERGVQLSGDAAEAAEPLGRARPIVEVRSTSAGIWRTRTDLVLESVELNANSVGQQRSESQREYGNAFEAGDNPVLIWSRSTDLRGRWIRVRLQPPAQEAQTGDEAPEPDLLWMGYVLKTLENPENTSSAEARGQQRYLCVGPERLLDQVHISSSWWSVAGDKLAELGWHPGFNRASGVGPLSDSFALEGNRAHYQKNGSYNFGETNLRVWSHWDMLEYVIKGHVQSYTGSRSGEQFPRWTFTADPACRTFMQQLTTAIRVREVTTARTLLDEVVTPRWGVDYAIVPTDDGFEVVVFTLVGEKEAALGYSIPANPSRYEVELGERQDVEVRIEDCDAQLYDAVEVFGERIVYCCSAGEGTANQLDSAWGSLLEQAYRDAAESADPEVNDLYRSGDQFADVFTQFRLLPSGWPYVSSWPRCDDGGELITTGVDGQGGERATLSWLPLLEGWDYAASPATNQNPAGVVPGLRKPFALIKHPDLGYIYAERTLEADFGKGAEISSLRHEWGLRVRFSPNHRLGKNHWNGAEETDYNPDTDWMGLDWDDDLILTLALRGDHRVRVRAALPAKKRRGWGLTKRIHVPGAELHVLAPQTVVGVNNDGTLRKSPASLIVLRDDREILKRVLAAAVGRYLRPRTRATVTFDQLLPATRGVGQLLEMDRVGRRSRIKNSPITGVRWDLRNGTTTISSGQATG